MSDTTTGAVERLAAMADAASRDERLADGMLYRHAAVTLRALAQERDAQVRAREEERAALNRAISLRDKRIQALCAVRDTTEAERDAARAEVEQLRELVLRSQACMPDIYEKWHADARAALAATEDKQ